MARASGQFTLNKLLSLPESDIGRLGIAKVNLLCASGLPDTEDLDISVGLERLEAWAEHVRNETDRHLYRFRQSPADYDNSEAYFRVLVMVTVLQQDCGVRYNPNSIDKKLFLDSADAFMHGLLLGKGGTCTNIPVLYVAVGRYLGYPMHLCVAKGHFFCRWQGSDGGERFNIETTNQGLNTFSDDYYMHWPNEISPDEVRLGHYLHNLKPNQELAHFMTTRGHCLEDRGHLAMAIEAYRHANRLSPSEPHHLWMLQAAERKSQSDLG